jgi:hypothetical protein
LERRIFWFLPLRRYKDQWCLWAQRTFTLTTEGKPHGSASFEDEMLRYLPLNYLIYIHLLPEVYFLEMCFRHKVNTGLKHDRCERNKSDMYACTNELFACACRFEELLTAL